MPRANRGTRAGDSREATQRRMPQTRHVGMLAIPDEVMRDAKKRGVVLRWLAEAVNNQPHPNAMNVQGRLMNGWKPVLTEQYPVMSPPVLPGAQESSIIRRGGLILCEIRRDLYDEERADINAENMELLERVNWADGPVDPNMPRQELVNRVDISQVETRRGGAFKD